MRSQLLSWYDSHKRDLPWRSSKDPYLILVSEIMLQQTGVETVIPKFLAFIDKFPRVQVLARAPLDQVLGLWQGLGYYRRAHALHQCAKVLDIQPFPRTPEGLRRLPGVGSYTSGAVASIAFNYPSLALDGNLKRILGRYFFQSLKDVPVGDYENRLRSLGETVLCSQRPGDFNEALMDLGAKICLPENRRKQPLCHQCPLASGCSAFSLGEFSLTPLRRRAPVKKLSSYFFYWGGAQTIWIQPQEDALLKGLWGVPHSPWGADSGEGLPSIFPPYRHQISQTSLRVKGLHVDENHLLTSQFSDKGLHVPWEELGRYPISTLHKKGLNAFRLFLRTTAKEVREISP